ncbi:hypothetical protein VNO78_13241 [Psophocarpus tetragonolobus]|uniref:Uncharacterized protein n=1 Tax=Psophocarpus tetragonolobus TaxID=3891 RepID=A0AAN9SP80_PSOTE
MLFPQIVTAICSTRKPRAPFKFPNSPSPFPLIPKPPLTRMRCRNYETSQSFKQTLQQPLIRRHMALKNP